MAATKANTLLIGVSGVSSSGKTTLARLLREIWPNTFILHEDDFYWPDTQIPVKNGVQDWDCLEAIDLEKLRKALQYIKESGDLPPNHDSKEDQNSVGETAVSRAVVGSLHEEAVRLQEDRDPLRIGLVDGFLLYSPKMKQVWELLDVRLFLRTSYETAKRRREARTGYVTIEGFWEDPPGYVDDVVWPNYIQDHQHLFVDGDVEGFIDPNVQDEMDLYPMPAAAEGDMTLCLEWANDIVRAAVSKRQS